MLQFINSIDVFDFIWIIPISFLIHELEEWNILRWYKRFYKNIPASTNFSIRLHIAVFSLAGFLLILFAYYVRNTFIFSIIFIYLSTFITTNTIQHIIWTFQYKAYSPGLITGIICFACMCFVNILFIINELVLLPFYGIFILAISPIIKTLRSKHEMIPQVREIHELFIALERHLRGLFKKRPD